MNKNIFISGLFLYPGKVGGAENYFYNLLKGINKNDYKEISLVLNKHINYTEEVLKSFDKISLNVKYNRGFYDYLLKFFLPKSKKAQLIFSPNYITPFGFGLLKVTTIHDVQYLHYPEYFSLRKRLWLYISHFYTLNRADRVICISENVKNDLLNFFGNKYKHKLKVIYNPIDFNRFETSNEASDTVTDEKYILSVAAQYPHKNLITLVRAFNKLSLVYPKYKLVLVGQLAKNLIGGNLLYQKELNQEVEKNINIIVVGYVSDQFLGKLYQKCDFFVFPSVFEGFGMPPVEAMGMGKPVITTRKASLEEVTLGNAVYVDTPLNDESFYMAMMDVIVNLNEYTLKAQRNKYSILEKYNPINIASQYLAIFYEVLYEKKNN
ncbi:MAG: glycosyltransferase family 1 protein [Sulfuricurvum sp.]|nr:glycosyltransferase family 1 protein [Sulfuricurvum sp.]